ncbi:S8 family serine peptidase [Pleomorphovibrio marinus]|uniref:S8 family serine peptidase n=1 Tax=Pleomorphovibrio marinus TaxID=2164132 RepID=UPI000E0C665A|nr:S8 family serine peptidase [Pleomorphovibrio marinus]
MVQNKFRRLFLLLVFACFGTVYGQDRFAIHYKYKPTQAFSLEEPENFLSGDALLRRDREKILVDSTDLPVSYQYAEEIEQRVKRVIYHSNWLNASIVMMDQAVADEISSLPFVDTVLLVARGGIPQMETGKKSVGAEKNAATRQKQSQAYEFQNDILGIPQMHAEGFAGKDMKIAVFDAGFLHADKISGMQHLFNENRILATRDFVMPFSEDVFRTDTHGTGSLSLLAAFAPNQMVAGAYEANYILCITEDVRSEFRIEEYNWVKAAEFADSLGVDIINSSLGYYDFDDVDMDYSKEDLDGKTAVISIGAGMAAQKGILVVTSNGNEGNLSWRTITAPADAEGVLAVGAVTINLERAGFSSVGPTADGRIKPELVAFGTGVTLWRSENGPSTSSGTSFSAPQIAALAAGLWQANPTLTSTEIKDFLLKSGHISDEPNMDLGFGIPNYSRAQHGIIQSEGVEVAQEKALIYPNPMDGNTLFIRYGTGPSCSLRLISPGGKLLHQWQLARSDQKEPFEINLAGLSPGMYVVELQVNSDAEVVKLLKR